MDGMSALTSRETDVVTGLWSEDSAFCHTFYRKTWLEPSPFLFSNIVASKN
jgi:hypothetical protein